ncbi:hypothetical protein L7F22_050412 [Adiantum nelumboides]|nr:hypothetical protein [Adiantum nelumboides]
MENTLDKLDDLEYELEKAYEWLDDHKGDKRKSCSSRKKICMLQKACERLRDAYEDEFEEESSDEDDDGWVCMEPLVHQVGIPKMEEKETKKEAGQKSLEEPLDNLILPLECAHGVEEEYPLLKITPILSNERMEIGIWREDLKIQESQKGTPHNLILTPTTIDAIVVSCLNEEDFSTEHAILFHKDHEMLIYPLISYGVLLEAILCDGMCISIHTMNYWKHDGACLPIHATTLYLNHARIMMSSFAQRLDGKIWPQQQKTPVEPCVFSADPSAVSAPRVAAKVDVQHSGKRIKSFKMLMQVGGVEGSRPTFFEMAAAQQLPASLRAALLYSLGSRSRQHSSDAEGFWNRSSIVKVEPEFLQRLQVLAQRRPILHKIIDYSDEAFGLLMLVLEAHSLRTTDASFAESLYGLRRRPVGIKLNSKQQATGKTSITRMHRYLSLLFLVGLPYLKAKAQAVYDAQSRNISHAAMWGNGDNDDDISNVEADMAALSNQNNAQANSSRDKLKASLLKFYPWIHATQEVGDHLSSGGICISVGSRWLPRVIDHGTLVAGRAMWISLRCDASVVGILCIYAPTTAAERSWFWDQIVHVLPPVDSWIVGGDFNNVETFEVWRATQPLALPHIASVTNWCCGRSDGAALRNADLRDEKNADLMAFQRAALKTIYNALDFAQTGLIASVFLFKMMEWWYQSAEERVSAPTIYPAPPPPPAPKVAEKGIPLPKDKRVCPLCMKKRTNPALVASSGFVFCYPCIFSYVSQYNRCPVTLIPAASNQIRRLFYDS